MFNFNCLAVKGRTRDAVNSDALKNVDFQAAMNKKCLPLR